MSLQSLGQDWDAVPRIRRCSFREYGFVFGLSMFEEHVFF